NRRLTRFRLISFRNPMDLRHLGAIWKGPAVTGDSCLVRVDHHRVSEDHSEQIPVMANGDDLPAFVASELGEGDSTRDFQRILVLLRQNGQADRQSESSCSN